MVSTSGRLVGRVQRLLQTVGPGNGSALLPSREVAMLEARVQRLRGLNHQYSEVGLSRYVTRGRVNSAVIRIGGDRVATEV